MATPAPVAFPRLPGLDLACEAVSARGLAVALAPDGGATLAAAELVADGVRAVTAQATVEIAQATLADVRAEVVPVGGVPQVASFAAREVVVRNLHAAIPRGAAMAAGPWQELRLDALATLDGLVRAFVTDALWFIDAAVSVPIAQGTVDFNAVTVEHIGPDSALGLSPAGIHVETPGHGRVDVVAFAPPAPPGVTAATGGRLPFARGDRGRLDLLPFLHALLAAPPGQPLARPADPSLPGALQRTRVTGELHLGDGTLARGGQRVELAGRATGRNRCTLDSPSLAQRLVITVPQFAASAASLALPGREVRAAALEAVVEAHVLGPGAPPGSPAVMLAIAQATLREVVLAPVP
ncbi:MAG: hypothetical protein U1F10_11810 [Burkholderiales bacterium]